MDTSRKNISISRKTKRAIVTVITIIALMAGIVAASLMVRKFFGNMTLFDTTYNFTYAQVKLPDGQIIEGDVEGWKNFQDGDMVQVTIHGQTYLVHSGNAALITGRPE